MHTITITSRLETAAEFGAYEISLFVWHNTKKRLCNQDIQFEDLGIKCRKGESYYNISWANAVVEDLPNDWTFEKVIRDRHLTQGQVLWLMAKDYERTKAAKNSN